MCETTSENSDKVQIWIIFYFWWVIKQSYLVADDILHVQKSISDSVYNYIALNFNNNGNAFVSELNR